MQRAATCSAETRTLRAPVERGPERPPRLCKASQSAQRETTEETGRKTSTAEVAGVDRAR